MIEKIGRFHNVDVKLGLTGFKWIAKMIEDFPNQNFIAGGEESYGYLIGDKVRDKDSVAAALLICEIENQMRNNGGSIYELLVDCYKKYGAYKERLVSFVKKGKKGINEIQMKIDNYRNSPPKFIAGIPVVEIKDYKKRSSFNLVNGSNTKIHLPKSSILSIFLHLRHLSLSISWIILKFFILNNAC